MTNLQKQVDDIRDMKDVVAAESIRRFVLGEYIESGNIDQANNINQDITAGAAATTLQPADRRLLVTIDGAQYYIPLYNV